MDNDHLQNMATSFGNIIVLSNMIQTHLDRKLKPYGLTAKQWFMLACIDQFFPDSISSIDNAPNLKELGGIMNTSYQNAKQIALKLETAGFIELKRDLSDKRVIRINTTEYNKNFWQEHSDDGIKMLSEVFKSLTVQDVSKLTEVTSKMLNSML